MYTSEEIEEEARIARNKTIPWVIIIGLIVLSLFYVNTKMEFAYYNEYNQHTMYYIMTVITIIGSIIIGCLPAIAYNNKIKQLEKENKQEEHEQREEHYRKMEELLEKMSEKDASK